MTERDKFECGCPTCRMARGEITPKEYAWYLKGRIEAISRIIKSKENNNFGKEGYQFKDLDQELRYTLMDDETYLSMLLEDKFKSEEIDPAWKSPKDHICKECTNEGSKGIRNRQG